MDLKGQSRWWTIALVLLWGLAAPLAGCNCEDTGGIGNNSELVASPPTVNFDGKEGETVEKKVLISAKQGLIRIDKISIVTGASHYTIDPKTMPELPLELSQGNSFTLTIQYKATVGVAPSGKLRIESDATVPSDGVLDVFLLSKINQQSMVLDPNPVDFGSVERGETKEIEVVGKNQGRANLVINKIVKEDGTSSAFDFPGGLPQTPLTVKPGETFKFKVTYTADSNPIDKGALLFTCEGNCAPDDLDPARRKDPYVLKLQGSLGRAQIEVEPTTLDFGFVKSGSEESKSFKIHNRGKATLKISKIGLKKLSSGAFNVPNLIDIEIGPGQSKEAIVRYRPTTGSEHKGEVEIHSNDPNKPLVSVQLLGKVTAPNIKVAPKELNFGKAPVFKEMELTISNTGNQPLIVEPLTMLPGTSQEFSFKTPPAQFTVNPNSSKKVVVVYKPVDNVDDTGKIAIKSNDPDEPTVEVRLIGLGLAPKVCDLIPRPSQVAFGLGLLGKAVVKDVELYNQGSVACELRSLSIATDRSGFPPYIGPDAFFLANAPPECKSGTCSPAVQVPPGNSIKLRVSFQPAFEKASLGNPALEGDVIYDAAAAGGQATRRLVHLAGIAVRPCIDVVPNTLEFGLVKTGCGSKKETVQIVNSCPVFINITKIGFSAAGANGVRIIKAPKTPFVVQANSTAEIELQYKATAPPKKQNAVLEIEHSFSALSPLTVTMSGEGTDKAEQTDTFKQPAASMADVLFVIDNSCSMSDEQSSLSRNISSFIQWAKSLKADFQLGITSTEVVASGGYQAGELRGSGVKIFTKNTPNLETVFSQAAKLGTGGQGIEAGLEAGRLALSPPMTTTGPNKGFLRKDASLSVIAISDEADQSNQSVQFYINFYKGLKGGPKTDQFRFHAVIGYDPNTKQSRCGSSGQGSSQQPTSSGRYKAVADSSGGIVASICNTNWASVFRQIGLLTFSARKQYYLSRPANPSTIVVKVNGSVVAGGASTWSYDQSSNGVFFTTAPQPGTTIEVTYQAICF